MSTVNINRGSAPDPKGTSTEACALERLPHIIKKMCLLWAHPEFDAFSAHLLMDSRDGQPYVLEINTLPGLTRASFIPQQLEAEGTPVRAFLEAQLELAQRRRANR